MSTLPPTIIRVVATFAPLFSRRVFQYVEVVLVGAILTPGRRRITNVLRMMGLQHTRQFQNYHRVLNRAQWSSRKAAQLLFQLLVASFVPHGPIVMGLDETRERRQGDTIAAKGVYRDAARSSKSFFVKASGVRWLSLMVLAPIPWAGRVWALPCLTVLAPSERLLRTGIRATRNSPIGHGRWSSRCAAGCRRVSQACQSHYWIYEGEVKWSGKWTPEEIAAGRRKEHERRRAYYEALDRQRSGALRRFFRWVRNLFE